MMRVRVMVVGLVLLNLVPSRLASADSVLARFDHDMHVDKVFKQKGLDCSHCHNFALDPLDSLDSKTKKLVPNDDLAKSAFRRPLKEICHGCHQSAEAKFSEAPHACFTCHRSVENLRVIKPKNHGNIEWRNSHATNARVNGQMCMDCHTTSQCVKCHLRRNDIELSNHTRNFKFFHSVQARMQPHKCDTCHSKSFCVQCHMGR